MSQRHAARASRDVWVPYLPEKTAWQRAVRSDIPPKTGSSPVVMVQSTQNNKSGRCELAAELMRHIKVDSYCRYLHNKDLTGEDLRRRRTKLKTIADYYFCLGENPTTRSQRCEIFHISFHHARTHPFQARPAGGGRRPFEGLVK